MNYLNAIGVPEEKQKTLPRSVRSAAVLAGAMAQVLHQSADQGKRYDAVYNCMIEVTRLIMQKSQ